MKLINYFQNPFGISKIALDNKKKFGEDALHRFATQNSGSLYDAEITAMEAAQNDLFGKITNVATTKAIAEARTKSVNLVMELFTKRVSKLNKFLELGDVHKTPVYQEFFPQGVMAFTEHVTKENIEQKMQFMVSAITANTAVAGGATVLAEFTAFLTNYNTARGLQLDKLSETSSGRSQREAAEDVWDDAFFNALLSAVKNNRTKPQAVALFFNQSILTTPRSSATDGKGRVAGVVTKSGAPLPNCTIHITDGNIDDETTDETGGFITDSLPIGDYIIVCKQNGVEIYSAELHVVDDGDTKHDITLP